MVTFTPMFLSRWPVLSCYRAAPSHSTITAYSRPPSRLSKCITVWDYRRSNQRHLPNPVKLPSKLQLRWLFRQLPMWTCRVDFHLGGPLHFATVWPFRRLQVAPTTLGPSSQQDFVCKGSHLWTLSVVRIHVSPCSHPLSQNLEGTF
jgi:hypothetical protein